MDYFYANQRNNQATEKDDQLTTQRHKSTYIVYQPYGVFSDII